MAESKPVPVPVPVPVLVLQYGQFGLTERCLKCLRDQTVPVQIILIDGCSPGRDEADLTSLAGQADIFMQLDDNLGYAGANNRALSQVINGPAPYVFIVNNDTELPPRTVERLVACADEHPNAAQVCPTVRYGDGRLQAQGGIIAEELFEPRMIGHLETEEPYTEPTEVRYAPGMAVLVRTTAIREVGLVPEGYFMYAEDVDWSLRFASRGWEIWVEPAARIVHFESSSSGAFHPSKAYYLTRAQVLLAARYLSGTEWRKFVSRFRAKVFRQNIKHVRRWRYTRALWQGMRAGLRGETGRTR